MENLAEDLLKQFIENDMKLILCGENDEFTIPLSVTAAKLYSPVLKATVETQLGKHDEDAKPEIVFASSEGSSAGETCLTSGMESRDVVSNHGIKRIHMYGYGHEIVNTFVSCLHSWGRHDVTRLRNASLKMSTILNR